MENDLPKPVVKPKKKAWLSAIWLPPLIALAIAIWLAVKAFQSKGPEIDIIINDASGIVAGKTDIRYKNIRVGKVKDLYFDDDLKRVHVVAQLDATMNTVLSSCTRFWVVKPRISVGEISGLSTLMSGSYIGLDPGNPELGIYSDQFTALPAPPRVLSGDVGKQFTLRANSLGSLDIGSPVYYRKIQVGTVTGYHLTGIEKYTETHTSPLYKSTCKSDNPIDEEEKKSAPEIDSGSMVNHVEIDVFVKSPYDRFVKTNSHFWNVSGFGLDIGVSGIKAHVASLSSLLSGGVEFDSTERSNDMADDSTTFPLYKNKTAVKEGEYTLAYKYGMLFSDSVRGLYVGAPVEYRGIKVGEVTEISFSPSVAQFVSLGSKQGSGALRTVSTFPAIDNSSNDIQVIVTLQPERLELPQTPSVSEIEASLKFFVDLGLRAQLKRGNLLTGSLFIDLVNAPEYEGELKKGQDYAFLPTIPGEYEVLSQQVANLLDKLNKFPIGEIGISLMASLEDLQGVMHNVSEKRITSKADTALTEVKSIVGRLNKTVDLADTALSTMDQTLGTVDRTVAADSQIYYDISRMAQSLTRAAQSFETLTEELNRKPNALIFGRE